MSERNCNIFIRLRFFCPGVVLDNPICNTKLQLMFKRNMWGFFIFIGSCWRLFTSVFGIGFPHIIIIYGLLTCGGIFDSSRSGRSVTIASFSEALMKAVPHSQESTSTTNTTFPKIDVFFQSLVHDKVIETMAFLVNDLISHYDINQAVSSGTFSATINW